MTTRSLNMKPSLGSLAVTPGVVGTTTTAGTSNGKPFKPCANCTCTPGLLWRQGRRTSQLLRKMSNSRRIGSQGGSRGGSNESIYSSDTIFQSKSISTVERLTALRKQMAKHDLCCYIIPSEDEHQSEYVAPADKRRAFISGFTGSAGVACVTRDVLNFNYDAPEGRAVLSTDGRYFNQAIQELDGNWNLIRQTEDKLTWVDWCVNEAYDMSIGLGGKPTQIGIDPKLMCYGEVEKFEKAIKSKIEGTPAVIEFVPVSENLVDAIWAGFTDQPERNLRPLFLLDEKYTGKCFKDKRADLFKHLKDKHGGTSTLCVVALDEICWLLNARGSDIDYNPVFFSYLLLQGDETTLFTDNPCDSKVKSFFAENGIVVKPYDEIWSALKHCGEVLATNNENIIIPQNASWELVRSLGSAKYERIASPIELLKAVKNSAEVQNARAAQVKDAVCLVQYFAWLEEEVVKKEKLVDENKAAEKLLEIRKTQQNFMGNSFETISSTGANAAIIHYAPPKEGSAMICPYKIYLCDAGSQFLEGTTDITRTLHFTSPTQEEIDSYTRVLKGNLALERMVFPEETPGSKLDVIARQFLWSQGLDYRHGTGHGVGSFLNVHEGPIGFGAVSRFYQQPLQHGNIITNEPGYYKDGEFGIRIENDMLVLESDLQSFGKKKFLKFENITLVPYCRKLINTALLTREEKDHINQYYQRIWTSVVPLLQPQSIAYKWLKRETASL